MPNLDKNASDLPTTDKDGNAITEQNPLTLEDVLVRLIERSDPALGLPVSGVLNSPQDSPVNWAIMQLFLRDIYLDGKIVDLASREIVVEAASTTVAGLIEILTQTEARQGIDTQRALTVALLLDFLRNGTGVGATTTRKGTIQFATVQEMLEGNSTGKGTTPALVKRVTQNFQTAAEVQAQINAAIASTSLPTWTTIPTQSVADGASLNLDLWKHLKGFAPITLSATGLPSGFRLNSDGTITGSSLVVGTHSVTITARNAYGTRTVTFTLSIVLNAPVWDDSIPEFAVRNRRTSTLDLNEYVSGAGITFSLRVPPSSSVATNFSVSSAGIVRATGASNNAGHVFTVRATNSAGFADKSISITSRP